MSKARGCELDAELIELGDGVEMVETVSGLELFGALPGTPERAGSGTGRCAARACFETLGEQIGCGR